MDGGLARSLDRHDLLLLSCEELVDLLDEAVVELFYFAFSVLSYVLRSVVCLDTLLDSIVGVTASIAYAYLGILCVSLDLLDEFATAVFGERGDAEADQLAIVLWGDAERGVDDSTLDVTDDTLFPRSDDNALSIGYGDSTYLRQRDGATIVLDHDTVEDLDVGLTGTYTSERLFEVLYGLLHLAGGLCYQPFQFAHRVYLVVVDRMVACS